MSDGTVVNEHTRRSFLDVLLSLGVLGSAVSVLYPVLRYLTPLPASGPAGPTTLTREEVATLDREQFVIVPVGGTRVLVVQEASPEASRSRRPMHPRGLHGPVRPR